MLERLNKINDYPIYSVYDVSFEQYGKILKDYNFSEVLTYLETQTQIPSENNIYVANDPNLQAIDVFREITEDIYGGLATQVGYCNGNSSKMNALENHVGYELNIGSEPFVLFLAKPQAIKDGIINSQDVSAFYVPAGVPVVLYDKVLHFAPCKVSNKGFKVLVMLLAHTNEDIELNNKSSNLFKYNKWIYVHPDRQDLIEKGAKEGIIGINYEVLY